ncbi:MAG: Rid family hydrolase [Xanthomonadales bacterium]|nr:Rid family hydrolase [Xanthomonadales bacterium]
MNRILLLLLILPATAWTETQTIAGANDTRIVVAADEGARAFHQQWGYAPAIRAGDFVVLSGIIAGPPPDAGTDVDAFKASLRRTFARLQQHLNALDASFDDVIKLNTYHVFKSPYFAGTKLEHMEAVRAIKQEFIGSATPTWTAIGVSELFTDSGLVEIEITAYAPVK